MRILIQRVRRASVSIGGTLKSAIGPGLLVSSVSKPRTARRISSGLRVNSPGCGFRRRNGVMNLDVRQVGGEILVVSQFTLHASTRKGNRPSYIKAAPEAISRPLYERFAAGVGRALGREVATGEFGADMQVELVNDGPVTIWIDSRQRE